MQTEAMLCVLTSSTAHSFSQAAIDLDLELIDNLLAAGTMDGFVNATRVYGEGAFSWPFAALRIQGGVPSELKRGIEVLGFNAEGQVVEGTVLEHTAEGKDVVHVQYSVSDDQSDYVRCHVGGNPNPIFEGCKYPCTCLALKHLRTSYPLFLEWLILLCIAGFAESGSVTIGGIVNGELEYSYNPKTDNKNDRTLRGFSTLAYYKMKPCHNCEYFKDFDDFMDYYGTPSYADDWIKAAFAADKASFRDGIGNFDADFTGMGYKARAGKFRFESVEDIRCR